MNIPWVVAVYHLRKHLLSKGFILTLLALPLFLGVSIGLGILIEANSEKTEVIGALDPAGVLQTLVVPQAEEEFAIRLYTAESEAQAALQAGEIQALYLLPADYPQNRQVELRFYTPPDWQAQEYFQNLLRVNLLAGQPAERIARTLYPPEISVHALKTGRSFPAAAPSAGNLAPTILALLYIFSLFPIAEILVGALGDEKANRTMEVLLTSIRPLDLILGKLAAVLIMVLVEISAWLLLLALIVWIGGSWLDVTWLQAIELNWLEIGQIALLSVSGLIFYSAALIFIGALLHQPEEMKQAASLVIMPLFLPLYVLPMMLENPQGTIGRLFALLPITSVQTQGIQILFAPLPLWGIWAAVAINLASAALLAWLAGRAFRRGMLRYGQGLRLKELFGANRPAQPLQRGKA